MDILLKNFQENIVVNRIEIFGYISLDEPAGSFPYLNFLQRCVTSSVGSEAMGMIAELRFVIRF